ncbi:MAG: ABC transporter ATP-binding protein, partial [Clostridia bacterium]
MFGIYHKYIARYKLPFCISILCVACEAACDLLGPTIMARVINEGIAAKAVSSVFHWGGMMLLIALAGAAFAISRSVLSSKISQRIGADLRHDLFQKIVHFSEPSADRLQGGSLITRMTNDTTQVTQFINGMMRIFIKAPITCVGSIVLASLLNLRLSLVVYASVAVVAVLLTISMKLSYRRFAKLQSAMDRLNSVVQEYLLGVRLVKAFGAYDEEARRFSQANTSLMKRGVSAQLVITLISPMISLTIGIGTVLILALGGRLFTLGQARPGDISAFVIYMSQILSSLLMITNIFNTFVRTKASTARIQEVLDAQNDFSPQGVVEKLSGAVAFEDVTFAYPTGSQVPALSKLSFCVRPGESLAVIGSTGSGKSTLCWLLLRFYDVNEGRILLDGRDIRTLDIDTVRQNVAIVPQKAMLFSGTVAQSIRWGDPNASDEAVRAARFVSDEPPS